MKVEGKGRLDRCVVQVNQRGWVCSTLESVLNTDIEGSSVNNCECVCCGGGSSEEQNTTGLGMGC